MEFFAQRKTSAVALVMDREVDQLMFGCIFFHGYGDTIFQKMDLLSGTAEILSGERKYCPETMKYYPHSKNTIRTPKSHKKRQFREQRDWHFYAFLCPDSNGQLLGLKLSFLCGKERRFGSSS